MGTVAVPYGSMRVIDWGEGSRHFNSDTHGFNFRVWKDGGPALELAVVGDVHERRVHDVGFIPQIYRLVKSRR